MATRNSIYQLRCSQGMSRVPMVSLLSLMDSICRMRSIPWPPLCLMRLYVLVIVPLWIGPESVEAQIGLSLCMRKSVFAAGKDFSMKMLNEMRNSRHLSG